MPGHGAHDRPGSRKDTIALADAQPGFEDQICRW